MAKDRVRVDHATARCKPPVGRHEAAIRAVSRTACRYLALGEVSPASGSKCDSAEVSVRSASIALSPSPNGKRTHEADHAVRERRAATSCDWRSPKLGPCGQPAMPQEKTDLLEGRMPGQIVNIVARVREHTIGAVEVTDGRGRRDNALESRL